MCLWYKAKTNKQIKNKTKLKFEKQTICSILSETSCVHCLENRINKTSE